jgi:predicted kinase
MELVIFTGLQGSGKSTFYQLGFAATHVLVSKDRFRHNRNKNRRQAQLITEALVKRLGPVVLGVDHDGTTADERKKAR